MMEKRGSIPEKLKGMVVDDHDLIRKSVAKVLRKMKFEAVFECSNGKDAKATIEAENLDLIVCDIDINLLSGFELLDYVRSLETGSDIPFIIVTGSANKDEIVKAADKGAEDYIVKPFQSEDMEAKIVKVLQQYFSPGPALARIRAAEKSLSASRFDEAAAFINAALKVKESPRARHLEAIILLKQKNKVEGLKRLHENIKAFPGYLKNYVSLANFFISENDAPKAIKALSQELEINPKQPLRQIKLANMYLKERNAQAAIEHYRLALLETNKNPEALYGMGTAFAMAGNMEKSIYYFKRYRRNHPKDQRPLKAILKFCEKSGQNRLAEVTLLDEKKLHPERMDVYLLLSEFYAKAERNEDAVATLEGAIKRKPDYAPAYLALANLYLKQGDQEGALKVYQDFAANSKDPDAYAILAQSLIQMGRFAGALQILQQAMQAKADPLKLFPMLIHATLKTKQYGKSYFLAQRLLQMGRPDAVPIGMEALEIQIADRRQSKNPVKLVS